MLRNQPVTALTFTLENTLKHMWGRIWTLVSRHGLSLRENMSDFTVFYFTIANHDSSWIKKHIKVLAKRRWIRFHLTLSPPTSRTPFSVKWRVSWSWLKNKNPAHICDGDNCSCSMSESKKTDTVPPDDTLGQPGEGSGQFVSNILGEVLDPSPKRHHHEAMLRCVIHPCLKILWEYERQTVRAGHKPFTELLCLWKKINK